MSRKLPHYGKYSYLAFEGEEPTNILKGQAQVDSSPLVVDLREDQSESQTLAPVEEHAPLAELPPVFSQQALMEHVLWLAAPERAGRQEERTMKVALINPPFLFHDPDEAIFSQSIGLRTLSADPEVQNTAHATSGPR